MSVEAKPSAGDAAPRSRWMVLLAGPLSALLVLFALDLEPGRPEVTRTAAVAVWMATWWMTEAVPLAVTALLPVVLFPTLGIMSGKAVAPLYFNQIIFLFLGGFMVALAMERWSLHKRIALRVLRVFGSDPRGMLLGFMAATAFLSMWISNTATTMMMVPIAVAVIVKLEDSLGPGPARAPATGLLMGVAYGASLGGIATLVGTPPNLFFAQIFTSTFPDAPEISFVAWMSFALPLSLVFLVVAWSFLSLVFMRGAPRASVDGHAFREQHAALGPMSYEEKIVLADFALLAALWLTRADVELAGVTLPGWSRLFANPGFVGDGTVAVGLALPLFALPSRQRPGHRVLDWATARRLPWGIVLLFGGGFALAAGFEASGLSRWVGDQLRLAGSLHPLLVVAAVCLAITFLTELTSNTATAEILLPILATLAVSIGLNPLMMMIPATLSCSLAFMLPVATPPNAIVFGTSRLRIADMARVGVVLNLAGAVLVTLGAWTLIRLAFAVDLAELPAWAG